VAEIVNRIQGWHDRSGKELEDLAGPEGIANSSRWFQPPYPLQSTWRQLIRVVLSAEAEPSGRENVRAYQKERLGRRGGLDCLLELLPLPSPGLNRWLFYPDYSQLPYLCDHATYTSHVAPARAAHLRERIAEHRPDSVIFYGAGYERWWRAISGVDFEPSTIGKVSSARKGHTLFVTMPHATAHGLPNSYFDGVGRLIAGSLLC
jgi:hypothetical protein